jgi:DNA replication and repair protein RecF
MESVLHLTHYRNYHDSQLNLAQHTVFVGPNGSGKTNIIEALRTLSVTKSYRITHDSDAIEWGEKYCAISLKQAQNNLEYILVKEEQTTKKVIKHNGTIIPLTQVYGLLPTVLFSPESIGLIDGSPQDRRRFLDTILSQADPHYIQSLLVYRKIMRERHYLLLRLQQGLGSEDEMEFWDSELVKAGEYITQCRDTFIRRLNTILSDIYPRFIPKDTTETFVLHYKPSAQIGELANKLKSVRNYDIKTATTNAGPHRDEVVFILANRNITLFASRGEMRRCILSTKLAEALYLQQQTEKEPLLLLDDVFSEFDSERRKRLLEAINQYQSVITTTDEAFMSEFRLNNILVHTLSNTVIV